MGADLVENERISALESRMVAVEAAIARLNSKLDPGFAVANIAAPVATAWLKEAGQHDYTSKFFALVDIGESALKYTTAVAFAAAAHVGGPLAAEIFEMFKQPPTLGKLAEGFRKVLDADFSEWPLNEIRGAFRRPNSKPTPVFRYLFDEFISIRNVERGHGSQQPGGHYESLYLKNHLVMQDCVYECKFLQLPLLHIHAVDHLKEQYAYQTTLLMGGAPMRSRDPLVTSTKMRVGTACVWDGGAHVLPLQEFVSYRYCTTCGLEHVFIAERITSEKVFYHSHVGNHRLEAARSNT